MAVIAAIVQTDDYPRLREVLATAGERDPAVSFSVFCADDDSAEMMLLIQVASIERAREFVSDADRLRNFLDATGMDYYPPVFVGDLLDQFGAAQAP